MDRFQWKAFYRAARQRTQAPRLNYRNPANYAWAHLCHDGKEYSLRLVRTMDGFRQTDVKPSIIAERSARQIVAEELAWARLYRTGRNPDLTRATVARNKAACRACIDAARSARIGYC